jgi:putative methionine-R-sulfoxide reductase with GAF domain
VTRSGSIFSRAENPQEELPRPENTAKWTLSLVDIAVRALRLPGTSGIAIALREGAEFVCRASVGETAPTIGVQFDGSDGITGECIRTGETIVCDDVRFDYRVNLRASEALGIASLVAIPIMQNGEVIGVLEAFAIERGALGHKTISKLKKLADEVASATAGHGQQPGPEDGNQNRSKPENVLPFVGAEFSPVSEAPFVNFSQPSPLTRIQRHSTLIWRIVIGTLLLVSVVMVTYWRYQETHGNGGRTATGGAVSNSRNYPTVTPAAIDGGEETVLRQLEAAARAGDPVAQVRLANALADGAGVPQDLIAAHAWYIIANRGASPNGTSLPAALATPLTAEQTAQVRMAVAHMFENGIGGTRDLVSAYYWLILADAAGAQRAKSEQERLSKGMDKAQVDQARREARAWINHRRKPTVTGK